MRFVVGCLPPFRMELCSRKVHHSRDARLTDTNYGNLFSFWDRLFSTFTPARAGANISYGLSGLDAPTTQTAARLLALPFRKTGVRPRTYVSRQACRSPG